MYLCSNCCPPPPLADLQMQQMTTKDGQRYWVSTVKYGTEYETAVFLANGEGDDYDAVLDCDKNEIDGCRYGRDIDAAIAEHDVFVKSYSD